MNDLELEAQYFKDSVFQLGKNVGVRIEAKSDEPFWSFVFKKILPHLKPEFYPQCYQFPSPNTAGKKCVLLLKEFADKELALCVDSDYDYLLENQNLNHSFIFQTYAYSFENYHCFSQNLKKVFQTIVNTEGVDFDFEYFLKEYSNNIYELLIQSLWTASQQPTNVIKIEEKFGKDIMLPKHFKSKSIVQILAEFKLHIETKIKNNVHPTDSFKNKLTSLDLTPENAYLFARGKNVYSNIVILLNHLKENFKNQIIVETENRLDKNTQRQSIFKEFKKADECLKKNLDFKECFLFKKLEQDLIKSFQ